MAVEEPFANGIRILFRICVPVVGLSDKISTSRPQDQR